MAHSRHRSSEPGSSQPDASSGYNRLAWCSASVVSAIVRVRQRVAGQHLRYTLGCTLASTGLSSRVSPRCSRSRTFIQHRIWKQLVADEDHQQRYILRSSRVTDRRRAKRRNTRKGLQYAPIYAYRPHSSTHRSALGIRS